VTLSIPLVEDEMVIGVGPNSGATQLAILDLRKEDAEKAGKEMVAKFGEQYYEEVPNSTTLMSSPLVPSIEQSGEFPSGQLQVLPVACDVSSEDSVEKAFADIVQRFGKVDVSPRVEDWDVGMKLADIYNSVWSILRVWWRTSRLLNVRRLYIFPQQAAILTYHARDRSYRKGQEGEFQCYINR
jgi:hypothetical protein